MKRGTVRIIILLTLSCLVALHAAEAQQSGKVARIGVLAPGSATQAANIEEWRQELRELGYVEGQNLTLEYRFAEGKEERLADLAAELIGIPVDLIVTYSIAGVRAARYATTTLPIVTLDVADPVEAGLVESVAHPGGNVTGVFLPWRETLAKRLELLKEALPGMRRVGVLMVPVPSIRQTPEPDDLRRRKVILETLERTARELQVELHLVEVKGPSDFEYAFGALAHGRPDALLLPDVVLFNMPIHATRIQAFAAEQRLPTMGVSRPYLMAYENRGQRLRRQAAVIVDKILHGTRPGDLPMERATDFQLTIDLRIAQELGVTIPESLLLRADKVFPVSGVPLPANLRIVPPDPRVPPALAAFVGKWVGTWEDDKTQELHLIVEAIDPPQTQVILAWSNDTASAGTADLRRLSNWFRVRGQWVEGALQVSVAGLGFHLTGTYRLQPDGTLAATHTWFGETSRTIMTRAQP